MDRKPEYDLIRIVAMLQVIALHSVSYTPVKIISSSCVVLFVMLSGALRLRDGVVFSRSKWTRSLLRLLIAFFVTSVCYAIIIEPHGDIRQTVTNIVIGYYHLWFLYMIAGLYLCIPILLQLKKDRNVYRLFLSISIITSILIPTFDSITCTDIVGNIMKNLAFLNIGLGYIVFFVIGDIISSRRFSKIQVSMLISAGILSKILLSVFGIGVGDFDLRQVLYSVACYLLLLTIGRLINPNGVLSKSLRSLSKQCFLVYLLHAGIIVFLNKGEIDNNWLRFGLTTLISFIMAYIINGMTGRFRRINTGKQ
ncbi:MAG: acyltransferase [Lachnospiraceae bacterium]|nr:acyltransferase [Lachnospiraceae bacterium]